MEMAMARRHRSRRLLSRWRGTRAGLDFREMMGPPLGGPISHFIPMWGELVVPMSSLDSKYTLIEHLQDRIRGETAIRGHCRTASIEGFGQAAPPGAAVQHLSAGLKSRD